MKLYTLDEFMELSEGRNVLRGWRPQNAHVRYFGFKALYVRNTRRCLEGRMMRTLDLAILDATVPGKGAFTDLFENLKDRYKKHVIYIESVIPYEFFNGLMKRNFVRHNQGEVDYGFGSVYYEEHLEDFFCPRHGRHSRRVEIPGLPCCCLSW